MEQHRKTDRLESMFQASVGRSIDRINRTESREPRERRPTTQRTRDDLQSTVSSILPPPYRYCTPYSIPSTFTTNLLLHKLQPLTSLPILTLQEQIGNVTGNSHLRESLGRRRLCPPRKLHASRICGCESACQCRWPRV